MGVERRLSSLLVESMSEVRVQARSRYSVTLVIVVSEFHVELDVGEGEVGVGDRKSEIRT